MHTVFEPCEPDHAGEVLTILDDGQLEACRDDGVVVWNGRLKRWERAVDALQEEVFDSAGLLEG